MNHYLENKKNFKLVLNLLVFCIHRMTEKRPALRKNCDINSRYHHDGSQYGEICRHSPNGTLSDRFYIVTLDKKVQLLQLINLIACG